MFLFEKDIEEQVISLSHKEAMQYDELYKAGKAPEFDYVDFQEGNYFFIINNENYKNIKNNYLNYNEEEKKKADPIIWKIFFEKIRNKKIEPVKVINKTKHDVISDIQKKMSTLNNEQIAFIYKTINKKGIKSIDGNKFQIYE